MITRISGTPRIVHVPIDANAIIEETQEKRLQDTTITIILALLHFLTYVGYVAKHLSAWMVIIAILTMLTAPAKASRTNPSASLNAIHKNWIWQHQGAAQLNPEVLLLIKTSTPCDLVTFLDDLQQTLKKNEELCRRKFPTALDSLPHINVTTASSKYVTLNGKLTLLQAKKQCEAIGSHLATAKTQQDAATLYGYMVDQRINETFNSIHINPQNLEPTFQSDGTLANERTTVFKYVESTRNEYKSKLTWNEITDRYKKDHLPIFFTYAITSDLTIAVFAHRETAPYELYESGGTGTTIRLKAICDTPQTDTNNPKVNSWRASCETNLRRNRRITTKIQQKINQILPPNLPKTPKSYPTFLNLNKAFDDKQKTAQILNIMGYSWDPILAKGARRETGTTPELFQKVYGTLLEESDMTIKDRCNKWLRETQPDNQHSKATNNHDPNPPIYCQVKPASINPDTKLYGCAGAAYEDLTPSPQYCRGGKNGEYPYYKNCCKWTGKKCVPRKRALRQTMTTPSNPPQPVPLNSTNLNLNRQPRYAPAIAAGTRVAIGLATKYARFAWPAVSASASLGSFFVDLAQYLSPSSNDQQHTTNGQLDLSQNHVDFDYAIKRYDNLQEANAFTEASFLEVSFLMTINEAAKFADEVHNRVTTIVHTQTTPDVTKFLSLEEFHDIRNELVSHYGVMIPSSMDTIQTTFTYTTNAYIAILAVPRQTDTSTVDIYKLLPLPLFLNSKTYLPTNYPTYVALTYKGDHAYTPLTVPEAQDCAHKGICEASSPTAIMSYTDHLPCGVDSIVTTKEIDQCTYNEVINVSEGTFKLVDNNVYYAVAPNSSITLQIKCRGSQQRGILKQTIQIAAGYGNFSLANECSAHYEGYVLAPARRNVDIDAWIPTNIGRVYADKPKTPKNNTLIKVAPTSRFPTKWGLAMKCLMAAAAAMIIALAIVCVMGHACPVTLISCCSRIKVRDIAKLFRHIDERNNEAANPAAGNQNPPVQNVEQHQLIGIMQE